jgi:hypothetical protein
MAFKPLRVDITRIRVRMIISKEDDGNFEISRDKGMNMKLRITVSREYDKIEVSRNKNWFGSKKEDTVSMKDELPSKRFAFPRQYL